MSHRASQYWNEPFTSPRRAPNRAFTLVEMLVSLAIVSAIVTMVYGSYAATSRSLDTYGRRMDCSERAHLVLRMMARQIRCAYMPSPETRLVQAETGKEKRQTPQITAFQGNPSQLRGEILRFTTTSGLSGGLDGSVGISRVAYRYDQVSRTLSIRSEPDVYRSEGHRNANAWQSVLGGLAGIELEFHDGQRWQPRWDSQEAGGLPRAVRIGLSIQDESGRTHRYATTVPILCRPGVQVQQVKKAAAKR